MQSCSVLTQRNILTPLRIENGRTKILPVLCPSHTYVINNIQRVKISMVPQDVSYQSGARGPTAWTELINSLVFTQTTDDTDLKYKGRY